MKDLIWKQNKTEFHINDRGVIWNARINNQILTKSIPIYAFVFNAYNRFDPSMKHLDDNGEISFIAITNNIIKFNKVFESNLIKNILSFDNNGFTWDINYDGISPKFHFGIVLPVSKNILYDNQNIKESLINYSRYKTKKNPGQANIELPIITYNINNIKYYLYTPYYYNVQFFYHKQMDIPCLRVSAKTEDTNELTVCLKQNPVESNSKKFYCFLYSYMNLSKSSINKKYEELAKKYNINIICTEGRISKQKITIYVNFDWPTDEELESAFAIIKSNLEKYPVDFATKLGINNIILCTNIHTYYCINSPNNSNGISRSNEKKAGYKICASGLNTSESILINVQKPVEEMYIHHEIFHNISHSESECDIYGFLMTNYEYIITQVKEGLIDIADVESVKQKIEQKQIYPQWDQLQAKNNVLDTLSAVKYNGNFELRDKISDIDNLCVNIIGTSRSGITLLAAILNCSNQTVIRQKYSNRFKDNKDNKVSIIVHKNKDADYGWLSKPPFMQYEYPLFPGEKNEDSNPDKTHCMCSHTAALNKKMSKIIYMTRHPLSMSFEMPNDPISNLRKWEKEQIVYLTYFQNYPNKGKIHIRYEDLLLSRETIERVFAFLNIKFDTQYLNYGDFDQNSEFISSDVLKYRSVNPDMVDNYQINNTNIFSWWSNKKNSSLIKKLEYDTFNIGE